MLVSQLSGGLGNQMFQWALVRSLSHKFGIPYSLDLSFLNRRDLGDSFVYRNYDLDIFEINPDFNVPEINHQFNEVSFEFSSALENFISQNLNENILICGFYQSPKYFNEELIRKELVFKNKIENSTMDVINLKREILESNSVMINVRRGDFLNGDFHGVYGLDYIYSAVETIKSSVENPKFFIFSDDVDWCRENIKLENSLVVSHEFKGPKFSHYLQLMTSCKHFIISNSSFAWWAAWLNVNPDKIVICPKRWFNRDDINTSDLIPNGWLQWKKNN